MEETEFDVGASEFGWDVLMTGHPCYQSSRRFGSAHKMQSWEHVSFRPDSVRFASGSSRRCCWICSLGCGNCSAIHRDNRCCSGRTSPQSPAGTGCRNTTPRSAPLCRYRHNGAEAGFSIIGSFNRANAFSSLISALASGILVDPRYSLPNSSHFLLRSVLRIQAS